VVNSRSACVVFNCPVPPSMSLPRAQSIHGAMPSSRH
jgi:hypothetical protein